MSESANIARHLSRMAALQPDVPALKIPRGRDVSGKIEYLTLSFAQLDAEVDGWVAEFRNRGVQPGDRVLVMVRQGLPLIAAAFALFKHGAVPIIIDPGMGLKSFLSCVARSHPRVLLGIPAARILSRVFRKTFATVAIRVPASGSPHARARATPQRFEPLFRKPADLAAILFTSGSTGAPKGVCYEHGMFEAQVRLIRATYDILPGEIDLPMLPIFALFNPALGMTTIVPEIDPSRPAMVDPAKIVQAIQQERVTNSFGSPTLWGKIAAHCIQTGTTLPTIKRVLCAGAPVPTSLWEKSAGFLPQGQLHSPYGATEALPVSSVSATEIHRLNVAGVVNPGSEETPESMTPAMTIERLPGTCVGRPVPEMQVKIIALTDAPIATLDEARKLPTGEIGEIIVSGPVVTQNYDEAEAATAFAKIQTPNSKLQNSAAPPAPDSFGTCDLNLGTSTSAASAAAVWHRMGDCGYLDELGLLWFCGRKVERVETSSGILFTEPLEKRFRNLPGVDRCALVGLGAKTNQTPALIVQPQPGADRAALLTKIRTVAKSHSATRAIRHLFFHPKFPVDVRHNAKIHRLTLAKWAAKQKPIEL